MLSYELPGERPPGLPPDKPKLHLVVAVCRIFP